MTPEQALAILKVIAESASMPKSGHIQAEKALQVLAEAIKR